MTAVAQRRPVSAGDSAAPGPGPILSEAWFATPRCVQQLLAQVDRVDVAAARAQQTVAGKSQNTNGGIRIIDIRGPMLKYAGFWTWFLDGVSTFELRNEVNSAASDNSVAGIILRIHSGGGEVAGTDDLGVAVREASKRKPVVAFIEDMGASAAYYVASQASRVVATESALIGSLGVVTVVTDSSEAYKKAGLTVHVVATSDLKGLGIAGRPISKADVEELRRIIEGARDLFLRRVVEGRRLPPHRAKALFDGRMVTAVEARELGLIDGIGSLDGVIGALKAGVFWQPGSLGAASIGELGAAIPSAGSAFLIEARREGWSADYAAAEWRRRRGPQPPSLGELRAALPQAPLAVIAECRRRAMTVAQAADAWAKRGAALLKTEAEERCTAAARELREAAFPPGWWARNS